MRRGVTSLCLGLFVLATVVTPYPGDQPLADQVPQSRAGWPLDDFSLLDQDGKPFAKKNLEQRWTLLVLGDSRCAGTCAATLSALSGLLQRIAGTRAVQTTQVVLVSFRSEDTAADLRHRLAPEDARVIGVTGPAQDLAGLADDLGVPYPSLAGQASSPAGDLDHAGSVWLIGPDAVVRAELLPPFDVLSLTATYLKTRLRG
jgi:protein SCO1/2